MFNANEPCNIGILNYNFGNKILTRLKVVYTCEGGRSAAYGPCRLNIIIRYTTRHLKENSLKVSAQSSSSLGGVVVIRFGDLLFDI